MDSGGRGFPSTLCDAPLHVYAANGCNAAREERLEAPFHSRDYPLIGFRAQTYSLVFQVAFRQPLEAVLVRRSGA